MTNNKRTRRAEEDERVIERIEAQILEGYLGSCDDYFEVTTMHLKDVLKNIIAEILQRHVAVAIDEIATALTDEIEALARDRLADLHVERGDKA
jgi:hypothetical protein